MYSLHTFLKIYKFLFHHKGRSMSMKKHTWIVLLFLNFALHGIVFPQGFYYKAGAGYNTEWPNEIIAKNSCN